MYYEVELGSDTQMITVICRTCVGIGRSQSRSDADCSWQISVLTAHTPSFARGENAQNQYKLHQKSTTQLWGSWKVVRSKLLLN